MGIRKFAAVLAVVGVLAAACGDSPGSRVESSESSTERPDGSVTVTTSSNSTSTATVPSTNTAQTTTSATVNSLPSDCQGLGAAPNSSSLTFSSGGFVYELADDGSIRCLVEHNSSVPGEFVWGAVADKILFADGHVITSESGRASIPGIRSAGFSRPTGTSVIWIQDGMLMKASVQNGEARVLDTETLEFGNELVMERAVYHPDGKHILISFHAPSEDTSWIYVTNNEGGPPSVLVIDEGAAVLDLQSSPDGTSVFFVVDHNSGHQDLHLLNMEASLEEFVDQDGVLNKFLRPSDQNQIETLLTGEELIHSLVVAPDGQRVMAAQGICEDRSRTYLSDLVGDPTPLLSEQNSVPVGFLDDQRVALLLLDPACDGSGDLVILDIRDGSVALIQGDVDGAAVRSQLPAAKMSLSDVLITGFA